MVNLTMGKTHMDELEIEFDDEPMDDMENIEDMMIPLDDSRCILCGKDIFTCVCTESDLDRFIFGMTDEEVDS